MALIKLIRLTKHFGSNTAGSVCGFTPETAAHILKHQGGELIGDMDTTKQVFNGEKIVDAVPEVVNGVKTGNLVPKVDEPEKQPAKK